MKRASYWLEMMRDAFLALGTGLRNWNVGSRIRSLFEAIAVALEEISFEADAEYAGLYAATSSGARLTMRAKELGLTRKPEQKATGIVRFTVSGPVTIPIGTKVATGDPASDDGVKEYATTEGGVAPGAGPVDLRVEAVLAGASGNVAAGEVDTLVDNIPEVTDVTNPSPIAGGADEETDEDLRNRCALAPFRMGTGQPDRTWEVLAGDVIAVARTRVISNYAGPGTFKVYVWSRDAEGNLVGGSTALVTAVQDYLDNYTLAGVTLVVATPPGPMQDVVGYVEAAAGHTYEEVAPLVVDAIEDLFAGLAVDEELVRAAITAAAMGVANVKDFRLSEPAANVTPGSGETIQAGQIRILPMEWDTEYGF